MRKLLLCGGALACLASAALAAAGGGTPPTFGGHAVFCNGRYALCIKAYCPTPHGLPTAGQTIDCECDIIDGWSMGPDTASAELSEAHPRHLALKRLPIGVQRPAPVLQC